MKYVVKALKSYLKSPLTTTATSIVLRSFQDIKLNNLALSDFGDFFSVVIKQGDSIEIIKCSAISIAADDTATLTVASSGRNIDPTSPYAGSSTGLAFQSGAEVIVTNDPLSMSQFANINIANTYALLQTFTLAPVSNADAVEDNELVRKSQLDAAVLGSLTTTPLIIAGNAGATLAADELVYLDVADSEWKLADADTVATVENVILGITRGAGTDGNPITNGVTILGKHTAASAIFTANTPYFASNTAGGFSTSAGTKEVSLGIALSTTEIFFLPRYNQQITEDQQDALGGTSGTPKATNKYVTENDTTNGATITAATISFDSASKEIRDSANGFVTAGFRAGQTIAASGTSGATNDGNYSIVSVAAGVIVVEEAVTNESAGSSITLAAATIDKVVRLDASGKLPAIDGSQLTNMPLADVQEFSSSGTWTKPTGAKFVIVQVVGAGGSGGSGRRDAAGTLRGGGGGGGGGAVSIGWFAADVLPATVAVTVGAATTGGAVPSDSNNGNAGSNGSTSSFGAWIVAGGGGGGSAGAAGNSTGGGGGGGGGSASSGTGGSPTAGAADGISFQGVDGASGAGGFNGHWGGGSGGGYTNNQSFLGGSSVFGAGAGGGGGGINAANVASVGNTGGTSGSYGTGGGATAGTDGASNTTSAAGYGGEGGGGGSGSGTKSGGDGGYPGGGGGGGAGTLNGDTDPAAGGDGASGMVKVITIF